MSTDLRRQIYESMNLRDTQDLLDIWKTNDRVEWSDEAFQVVSEVLRSRGVELPEQGEAILAHDMEDEPEDGPFGFTDAELKIVDDENPPDFYDPFEVLRLGRWLKIAAVASIVITVLVNLSSLSSFRNTFRSILVGVAGREAVALILAILFAVLVVSLQVIITYLPLRALAHILRILMQMEFNSRKRGRPDEQPATVPA